MGKNLTSGESSTGIVRTKMGEELCFSCFSKLLTTEAYFSSVNREVQSMKNVSILFNGPGVF